MTKKKNNDLISNRKAFHNYEVFDTFEAGIALVGTEIKSLRDRNANLQDSYVDVKEDELYLVNSYIGPYTFGNIHNHEERRKRKLLMHKKEILKLKKAISEKGMSIIALSMYLKNGKVKVKIAIAKGKKLFDKRQSIKEKEQNKKVSRALKQDF
jgi:SsrA-binding protein